MACSGCTGSCAGSCKGCCYTSCSGGCSGSCGGCASYCTGCSSGCSASCGSQCHAGCSGTSCTASCDGGCLGCNTTCNTGCNTTCSGGCSGSCGGGCYTGCASDCKGLCSLSCTSSCSGCSGSCSGGCSGCSFSCSGGCSGCSGSCSGGCSGCGGCSGSCVTECTGCSNSCTGLCNGCSTTCTGCTGTCNNGCSVICVSSCYTGCSGCTGTCQGGCFATCGLACVNSAKGVFNIVVNPIGSVWVTNVDVSWTSYNNNVGVNNYKLFRKSSPILTLDNSKFANGLAYIDKCSEWSGVGYSEANYYVCKAYDSNNKLVASSPNSATVWLEDLLPPTKLTYSPNQSMYLNTDNEMQQTRTMTISWSHSITLSRTGYVIRVYADNELKGQLSVGPLVSTANISSILDAESYREDGPTSIRVEVSTLRNDKPELSKFGLESAPAIISSVRYVPYPTDKYGKALILNTPMMDSSVDKTLYGLTNYPVNTPLYLSWNSYPIDHYGYYDK